MSFRTAGDSQKSCPMCTLVPFELVYDQVDVDVGVGVIERLLFGSCVRCGQIAVNDCCMSWECEPHNEWCGQKIANEPRR